MFSLDGSLKRLKERLKEKQILKSENPTTTQITDTTPDLEALASEVTELLDEGTVKPETDKVEAWAVSRGVSEEQAKGFADTVIDAYFDEDSIAKSSSVDGKKKDERKKKGKEKEKKDEGEEENEEEKEEKEKSRKDEVEKAGLTLLAKVDELIEIHKSDLQVLAASIEYLMEKADSQPDYSGEIQKLKSELAQVSSRPITTKTPVTQSSVQSVNIQDGQIPREQREKYFSVIQKGIIANKCQLEDINYFESTWKLPPRVLNFIQENSEVLK